MSNTIRRRVEVLNEAGLHARPAAVLAECARGFEAEVSLELASVPEDMGVAVGTRVDAKSVMDVLFLAAPCGTQIDIEATGTDADAAVDALEALFGKRFGIV
ncbi:MAG: HPr family phosphocarrier protein [Planctomycetota bacterium]|nr:HPr family phosphocarrier protein [Planctomycetota bacterium]